MGDGGSGVGERETLSCRKGGQNLVSALHPRCCPYISCLFLTALLCSADSQPLFLYLSSVCPTVHAQHESPLLQDGKLFPNCFSPNQLPSPLPYVHSLLDRVIYCFILWLRCLASWSDSMWLEAFACFSASRVVWQKEQGAGREGTCSPLQPFLCDKLSMLQAFDLCNPQSLFMQNEGLDHVTSTFALAASPF